jgi:hypothetical protein
VDNSSLLLRVLAAGVPLLLIALIAGAAGYVSKRADQEPVPPLSSEAAVEGVRGSVQSASGDELTIVTASGEQLKLRLLPDARIEVLTPMPVSALRPGDWVNGGAIPHANTVLALTGLVMIPDPVVQSP